MELVFKTNTFNSSQSLEMKNNKSLDDEVPLRNKK